MAIYYLVKKSGIMSEDQTLYSCSAAAKSLQSCLTLCDPTDAAHQAPPSLGFSRQEYWNGLPFPSPMHGSEKWKWSRSVVSDSSRPHGLQPTRLLRPWDFPGKSTGVGCQCLLLSLFYYNLNVWSGLATPLSLRVLISKKGTTPYRFAS